MKIPYFCCIGAELKRYTKDFDFMNQVYLYKVPTDDTIDEVLAQDYFKAISDSVLQDDIVYIYEASAEILHECRFDKQNGHITAVPLASDETLTGAVTTIIHDNLTPNRIMKSDEDGKVAVSDLTEEEIKGNFSVLLCTVDLSKTIDTITTVSLSDLQAFSNLDSRPSIKVAGALVVDNDGNRGKIESVDETNQTATIVTTFVAIVDNFTGATATEDGAAGLVPAPSANDQDKFLGGDGSWKAINLDVFLKLDGTSIMTGPLKMRSSSSFKCAIAPSWDGVGFYKLNDNDSLTLIASIETTDGLCPAVNNTYNIGKASYKWKDLYLSGKAYVATINNGDDLIVPANKSGTLATTADVNAAAVPVGAIVSFAAVPVGWLACDGSAVSRTDYADLFAVIGTTFGPGDGISTFNLPDFTDGKSPIGVGTNYALGTSTNGAAPNITGSSFLYGTGLNAANADALYNKQNQNGYNHGVPGGTSTSSSDYSLGFDASRSSSVYGANNTTKIVTSGTAVYICIRY